MLRRLEEVKIYSHRDEDLIIESSLRTILDSLQFSHLASHCFSSWSRVRIIPDPGHMPHFHECSCLIDKVSKLRYESLPPTAPMSLWNFNFPASRSS
jgi:hypothetical protein